MENAIKLHTKIYVVTIKSWKTYEVTEQAWLEIKRRRLDTSYKWPVALWDSMYNKFELVSVEPNELTDDVDVFILKQKKTIRDKINAYAKSKKMRRNSIEHVQNFISANT